MARIALAAPNMGDHLHIEHARTKRPSMVVLLVPMCLPLAVKGRPRLDILRLEELLVGSPLVARYLLRQVPDAQTSRMPTQLDER